MTSTVVPKAALNCNNATTGAARPVILWVHGGGFISSSATTVYDYTVLLAYEHSLVSPRDLRRLNAAFFTMNGVIATVFLAFVAADLWFRSRFL